MESLGKKDLQGHAKLDGENTTAHFAEGRKQRPLLEIERPPKLGLMGPN